MFAHVPCALRDRAGEGGYAGSFLDQYLVPILYPGGLTRGTQIGLGVFVLVVNIAIYTAMTQRWK